MKKILATALACVMSASALACLAACGGEKEKADRDVTAYADGEWDAKLDLTGLQKGDFGEISPDLYGLFLEDINYASFALDDNLIVNGSFETVATATKDKKEYGWTESGATIAVQSGNGALHANNQNYAQITSTANGKIANSGHPAVPIAVSNGVDYTFSMFIKDYAGDVTVTVKDKNGDYATGTFTVTESAAWTKYIKTITATANKYEDLSVEISFSAADTFSVDSIMLETTEATDFGMKNYMYEAIANLGPKFFRFPGGCVIEGTNLNEAYDWKNSIGVTVTDADEDVLEAFTYPVNDNGKVSTATTYGEQATRKPNVNIWQGNKTPNDYYDHEYGIGFYEYFCLCEALGAKAVPIVSCGMKCQTQGDGTSLAGRHGKGVADYIQDAIDLLEFAKGDKNTKWGKVRADMGHPEPFEMDYLGVGNEQWQSYYTSYYEQFLKNADFKAALAKYNVRTIVGNWVGLLDCEDIEAGRKGVAQKAAEAAHRNDPTNFPDVASYGVHDQHYYVNYTDLFSHTKMYDDYKRNDEDNDLYYYDVFVGEYAANTATGVTTDGNYQYTQNDWLSALSEAAMMTGFERNGDIIKMAAYAPMFAVADRASSAKQAGRDLDNQWNAANMMYFTNREVVCTPSYFVQQLFMHNAGTQKVVSKLAFANGDMPTTTINKVDSNGRPASGTFTYDNIYYVTSYNEDRQRRRDGGEVQHLRGCGQGAHGHRAGQRDRKR